MSPSERILIVDDDSNTCTILKLILSREGYEVDSVGMGETAKELVGSKTFNLVLLDIKLPDIKGIDLIELFKRLQPDMAIMMMTAFASQETAIQALNLGASAYINKPFNMQELLLKIKETFEKQKLLKERESLNIRLNHVNSMLHAIRNVNRRITKAKNRDQLLQGVCEDIIKARDFKNVWIVLVDESEHISAFFESGLSKEFRLRLGLMKNCIGLACINLALSTTSPLGIASKEFSCVECPLRTSHSGGKAMSIRLEIDDKIYGVLVVSLPTEFVIENIELSLLHEMADDVAFALYNIDLERKREIAKDKIRYHANLLNRISDAIISTDMKFNIKSWNKAAELIYGWKEAEVIGKAIRELVQTEYLYDQREDVFKELMKNEKWQGEVVEKTKDGEYINILSSVTLLKNSKGNPTTAVAVNRDITEKKQAEQALRKSENQYKRLMENLHAGVIVHAADTSILMCNQRAPKLLGLNYEQVLGKEAIDPIWSFLREDGTSMPLEEYPVNVVCSTLQPLKNYVVGIIKPDQTGVEWVLVNAFPFFDEKNTLQQIVVTFIDITERKQTAEALRLNEEKLRKITETSPDCIMMLDLDCNIQFINRVEQGLRKEDILNTPLYNLVDHEERGRIEDILRGVINQKKATNYETIYERPDGTIINYESLAVPLESEGNVIGIIVNSRDVTERKKAEITLAKARDSLAEKVEIATRDLRKEKQRIETVVETIPDGIVVIDPEGEIYLVNKVFKDFYNRIYSSDFPTSLKELSLLENPFGDTVSKLFYSTQEDIKTIEPIKGLHLQLASSRVIITPDIFLGIIISVRDVTPFVELDNLRKQFVSVVSHELRTPITAINLSLRNLQKFRKKISEEQLDAILDMTADSAAILTQMIEDLLIASRIEAGKIQLKWVQYQLSNIIQDVLNVLDPRCVAKSIRTYVDINLKIVLYGDERRISQIFRILVDNAIKYSHKNSSITIKATDNYQGHFNPDGHDGTLIQIIDNGRGIQKDDLPHIFDRFFRSNNVSDKRGSGLGLSIAQEMCILHRGQIFVESEFGKGSTFSVFLPRIEILEENSEIKPHQEPNYSEKQIS